MSKTFKEPPFDEVENTLTCAIPGVVCTVVKCESRMLDQREIAEFSFKFSLDSMSLRELSFTIFFKH